YRRRRQRREPTRQRTGPPLWLPDARRPVESESRQAWHRSRSTFADRSLAHSRVGSWIGYRALARPCTLSRTVTAYLPDGCNSRYFSNSLRASLVRPSDRYASPRLAWAMARRGSSCSVLPNQVTAWSYCSSLANV